MNPGSLFSIHSQVRTPRLQTSRLQCECEENDHTFQKNEPSIGDQGVDSHFKRNTEVFCECLEWGFKSEAFTRC